MLSNFYNKFSELGLIDYFGKTLNIKKPEILKGIGDDAAVVKISKNKYLLNTCDMLIEGKHFRKTDDLCRVGYKAIACSLSDIAAMGGKPRFSLISLGIPESFGFTDIKSLSRGIKKACDKFSVSVIGGDTNSSHKLIIDVSIIGFVHPRNLVLRNNAKPGDYIFVTGSLGGSIYRRHLEFLPRVKESQFLTNKFKLHSMIDISDGLVIDLWRILKASGVGAVIFENLIPIHKDAKGLKQALYMGEDFELLFTVSEKEGRRLLDIIRQGKIKFPLSFIGKVIHKKSQIQLIDKNRKPKMLKPKGFLHF
ncbi:MAG: thiamine-phosphate kinase [Candidatus Omnitrophica bacterium]|nr:thiamine-phosphate kinase [Candidatus Omnitrophota bacterium]MDD5351945.1 thiamine-phosphate kinase [Candidatus Omnitrophota bacterium]MDD5550771.1 thiamine-phosphate kinase [Candidatus Omnitrophota bacterium]